MKKLSLLALLLFVPFQAHAFKVGGLTWLTGDGVANQCVKTNGSGSLGWEYVVPTDSSGNASVAGNLTVSGTGASSFAGNVNLTSNTAALTIGTSAAPNPLIQIVSEQAAGDGGSLLFKRNTVNDLLIGSYAGVLGGNSEDAVIYGYNNLFLFSNGTQALELDTSQNGTLAGNLTVSGTGASTFASSALRVSQSQAGYTTVSADNGNTPASGTGSQFVARDGGSDKTWLRRNRDGTSSGEVTNADGPLYLKSNGSTAATFDTSQNTTLAGNLAVSGGVTPTGTGITAGTGVVIKNANAPAQNTTIPSGSTSSGDTAAFAFGAHTSGILIVNDTTNYKTATYVIYANGSALGVMTADTEFSTTANTNSKVNVTVSGGTISIQNYTGSSITVQVTLIQG